MKYILAIFVSLITTVQAEISLRQYNDQFCYDGDTCYVTINGMKKKIRLLELDTPEISKPKCNAELKLGLKARDYLNDLIANASTIEFKTEYLEDYFGRMSVLTLLTLLGMLILEAKWNEFLEWLMVL